MASIQNHQLVELIKKRQGDAPLGAFAKTLNVNLSTLSEILNSIRPVTGPVARAMGYKRMKTVHVTFAKSAK